MNPFEANDGLSIVVVEDHALMREVFCKACMELGHRVVAAVDTGAKAITAILSQQPQLLILDLALPDLDGFAVWETIQGRGQHPRTLAVSSHCDANTIWRVEKARFDGFVDKRASMLRDLGDAVFALSQGRKYFSETFVTARQKRHHDPLAFHKILSDRQQEILSLIGELLNDDEIAGRMEITSQTAEKHRFRILRRLGLHTRSELVRYAHKHGLVKLTGRDVNF